MGRKPNQLVLEYFDRGVRLNDSSNRYEQTCKACNAHFPKGRIESLIAHVEKKCPALKEEDRLHVTARSQTSSPHISDTSGILLDQPTQPEHKESIAHRSTLPVGDGRSLTGLEALAEASRQLERPARPGNDSLLQHHLIDPDLDNASFRPSAPNSDLERTNTNMETANVHPEIEASAGRTIVMPGDERRLVPKAADSTPQQHIRLISDEKPRDSSRSSEKSYGRSQKVRGKFTDLRRQEVQKIRKKGACIRCRMLRKTELEIFQTGLFKKVPSQYLEQREGQGMITSRQSYIRLVNVESDVRPMSFSTQDDIQQNSRQSRESKSDEENEETSIFYLNETIEQISSKLLSYIRTVAPQLVDQEPSLLTNQTFVTAKTSGDKLLMQALDLWALTQVIISEHHDWSLTHSADQMVIDGQSRIPHETQTSQRPAQSSQTSMKYVTRQLQAAAEQQASIVSKNIMIDLEKRLERKDKCQGAETFFVGITLLYCVERMTWAILRQSHSEERSDVCEQS
ncbi:MAG: hypothetical protein Q9220_001224 [cf. Caloplaca sp. 1 TL-2023]